jgi:hypothetical protein
MALGLAVIGLACWRVARSAPRFSPAAWYRATTSAKSGDRRSCWRKFTPTVKDGLPPARPSSSARKSKPNGKSTSVCHRNWFCSWAAKSVGAGSADSGVNQPGTSPRAETRASRACPCGVFCAAMAAASALPRLAAGSPVMLTTWTEGSSSFWKANAESTARFQVASPPDSTPHSGRAALNWPGKSWIRPAVMMPPSESPQAMVCRGAPKSVLNDFLVAIWSGSACWMAQPVPAYEEPASAKPWLSSHCAVTGS